MSISFVTPAPGFEQPIAVLKHCHDRIRKQLATLQRLLEHLPRCGADLEAQQAAHAVLRYFNEAAPLHHQDEEEDLLPILESVAIGDDAIALQATISTILQEHKQMEAAWKILDRHLSLIASGQASALPAEDVRRFVVLYDTHMALEETMIAPMAKRIFTAEQMCRLGDAMRARRGLSDIERD